MNSPDFCEQASSSRRRVVRGVTALAALAALPRLAGAQGSPPQAGTDYLTLKTPQPVETGAKIEVLEFFQYSCPHCFAFMPDLETWRKKLPADVTYRRNPVAFAPQTLPHVKLYLALESLGKVDDLHTKIFSAFHVDKKTLFKTDEIIEFVGANGVNADKFRATFESFSINARVNRVGQVWQSYQIEGTPTLACDGKFVTSPSIAKGSGRALAVMDFLIPRARQEHGKK